MVGGSRDGLTEGLAILCDGRILGLQLFDARQQLRIRTADFVELRWVSAVQASINLSGSLRPC
jgi:hypothetical protein